MDRRTTLRWMLTAAATMPVARGWAATPALKRGTPQPYGSDPKLLETYHAGDLWPLTFSAAQRQLATALCDVIVPADTTSPSASAVGVVDFIDEWISAPYALQQGDRKVILDGFAWLDGEASRRFSKTASALDAAQWRAICDDICYLPKATPQFVAAAAFFARYRDLTAGGFHTTPAGRTDLQYVGNTPLARFDGPPLEVLKKVGLA